MLLPGLLVLVTGMLSGSGLWGGDGTGDGGLSSDSGGFSKYLNKLL